MFHIPEHKIYDTHTKTNGTNAHLHFFCNTFLGFGGFSTRCRHHNAILNENICSTGFLNFFFAHKKIKLFRVGGKNRVGRVTPIKQFFFLGLIKMRHNKCISKLI